MRSTTLHDRRPPAVICRERGWEAGTKLVGSVGFGPRVIEITAVGQERILARQISYDGQPDVSSEGIWCLDCRDWQEVQS